MFFYTHTEHSPTPAGDGDDQTEIRSSRVITVITLILGLGGSGVGRAKNTITG
jgi:hypothetical protein